MFVCLFVCLFPQINVCLIVGKHEVLLDKTRLVVERGGCGLGKGEAASIQAMERTQEVQESM